MKGAIAQARRAIVEQRTKGELIAAMWDLINEAERMERRMLEAEPLLTAIETVAERVAAGKIQAEFGRRL